MVLTGEHYKHGKNSTGVADLAQAGWMKDSDKRGGTGWKLRDDVEKESLADMGLAADMAAGKSTGMGFAVAAKAVDGDLGGDSAANLAGATARGGCLARAICGM